MLGLAATYAYDVMACFYEFGSKNDDCRETIGFVLFVILPIWLIIFAILLWAFFYLAIKLRVRSSR